MNNFTFENGSTCDDKFSNNPRPLPNLEAGFESRLTQIDQNAMEAEWYHRAKKHSPGFQNEDTEYVVCPEPIAIPIHSYFNFEPTSGFYTPSPNGNPPRMRQNSEGSEISGQTDSRRSSLMENSHWRPPISIPKGFAGNAQISYAKEAINAVDDDMSSLGNDEDTPQNGSSFRSKSITFFSNALMSKFPKRSWFCDRCRKPRDECVCLCSIS